MRAQSLSPSVLERLAIGGAAGAALLAVLALAGWSLDLPRLASGLPGTISMVPNTAAGLLLAAAAIAVHARAPRLALFGRVCSALLVLLALVNLGELLSGRDLGIDQMLMRLPKESVDTPHPGRMALGTCMGLLFLGVASLSLGTANPATDSLVQVLAVVPAYAALLALAYHTYGAGHLAQQGSFVPMAIPTALGLLSLAVGLVAAAPRAGLTRIAVSSTLGGRVVRRILPLSVLIPFALGWLWIWGEERGLYDPHFGIALFTIATALVFLTAVLLYANLAYRYDLEQEEAMARLRESEARFRHVVLESPLPLMLSADNGEVLLLNKSWTDLSGYGANELRTIDDWLTLAFGERKPTVAAVFGASWDARARTCLGEFQVRTRSGETRTWETHVAPVGRMPDGRRLIIGMAVDHTELREIEAVRERAARLEAANKELEAFSYSVSHDLRAPLRAIDGFSRILVEDYAEHLDDLGKNHLERIQNASKKLDLLIEDMLEYSRVSRSDFSETTVDLGLLGRELADDLRAAAPEREVELEISGELRVKGDPQLLRRVLQNLLGNAWKFTSKRSAARIVLGELPASKAERTFFVRDNGAGFRPEHAGKLFGMFQRLHATSAFPGTGVGLAIVRRIVERHGGRVWAEGKHEEGATFYFTLPFSKGAESHGEDDTAGRGQC